MKTQCIEQQMNVTPLISVSLQFHVENNDSTRALDMVQRIVDYWQFALADPICRAKFQARNPVGYKEVSVEKLGDVIQLAKGVV